MTRRSLSVAEVASGKAIRRRSLLARGGAALGLIGAQFAGLVPEMGLASAAGGPRGSLRARELFGDEADRTHAAAAADAVGGGFRAFLATHHFTVAYREAALSIEDDAGSELARSVGSTWSDGVGRSARLIQHQAGREQKASLAIWDDGKPTSLRVYGLREGHVAKVGTLSWAGRTVTVVDESGERRAFTLPTRSAEAKMKAGSLASVSSDPICTICEFVIGLVCTVTCEMVFFIICVVILVLDLPAAFYCAVVSAGVCFYGCFQVTNLVCQALC